MDLGFRVAVGLAGLCRTYSGELRSDPAVDAAVRGALLTDLVLTGRLTTNADTVSIATQPTGFAPADRLLAAIAARPSRSLEWWLRRGAPGQRDLAEHLVVVGQWRELPRTPLHRKHRYEVAGDPDNRQAAHQRHRVHDVFRGTSCDVATAALSCLALAAGLMDDRPPQRPRDDMVARCGPAAGMVHTVVNYLAGGGSSGT